MSNRTLEITRDGVLTWLATKPRSTRYNYNDREDCLLARYASERLGLRYVGVGRRTVTGFDVTDMLVTLDIDPEINAAVAGSALAAMLMVVVPLELSTYRRAAKRLAAIA